MSRTSSSMIPVVVFFCIILVVLAVGAYLFNVGSGAKKRQSVQSNETQTSQVSISGDGDSSASATPSVSGSDSTGSIEDDLNSTEISDDPSLFLEVETGVSGL